MAEMSHSNIEFSYQDSGEGGDTRYPVKGLMAYRSVTFYVVSFQNTYYYRMGVNRQFSIPHDTRSRRI